jgi:hypothetical protein
VADIEDHGHRSVLLRLRGEVVRQKRLARFLCAGDLNAKDATDMPIEIEDLLIGGFEWTQVFAV